MAFSKIKWLAALFVLLWFRPLLGVEVTFKVTVPPQTPSGDLIYIAGDFNHWDPGPGQAGTDGQEHDLPLIFDQDETWQISLEFSPFTEIQYKYTRGSWQTVEKGPAGEEIPHRTYTIPESAVTIYDVVARWRDTLTPRDRDPYLSFVGDPESTITISWETETPGESLVEYGFDTTYGLTISDTNTVYRHSLELTGLAPGNLYHYRVLTPGGYTSGDHTFKTAPQDTSQPFTFVVWGDSRTDDYQRRRVKDAVIQADPDFSVFSGDMVEDGRNQAQWDEWFSTMSDLMDHSPFMACIGNHEENSSLYYELFYLPVHTPSEPNPPVNNPSGFRKPDEAYYSFTYGNSHFVVLSSEPAECTTQSYQYLWMKNDLKEVRQDPRIQWIFVFFHQPPYSSGNHGSRLDIRNVWCPVFESYGVDIVFNGHDHDYERSIPINNPIDGVVYIVSGGAGAPLYPVGSSWWTAYSCSIYHFCQVTVAGSHLRLEAKDTEGRTFDTLNLTAVPSRPEGRGGQLPQKIHLFPNYPNPFNSTTTIHYRLSAGGGPRSAVTLRVYNLLAQEVKTLVKEKQSPGYYTIRWEGRDRFSQDLPCGVYICRLLVGEESQSEKVLLLR